MVFLTFDQLNYNIYIKKDSNGVESPILNAADYGIPQNRERLIYIGNRVGVDNDLIFDEIEKSKTDYCNSVLADALQSRDYNKIGNIFLDLPSTADLITKLRERKK